MFQSKVKSTFKILDFDIEARPLSYLGHDYTTKEITAIAWQEIDKNGNPIGKFPRCYALGEVEPEEMLTNFVNAYNDVGMVVGHYIRGYDLPTINMALIEYGLEPLGRKLTHDTCSDLVKHQGFSKSQENLADLFDIALPKIGMSQVKWRDANRLTEKGIFKTKERVVGDVQQNIALRNELIARKLIGKPKIWEPIASRSK